MGKGVENYSKKCLNYSRGSINTGISFLKSIYFMKTNAR